MKAEHRKELETNVLADRVGRLVQRVKHRPQRRAILYLLAIVVVAIGIFIFVNMRKNAALEASEHWRELEDGWGPFVENLIAKYPQTNPGKAAQFQVAWFLTWDRGLVTLGRSPVTALRSMDEAAKRYRRLADECSGDPVWEPEALYALAVIEETRAIRFLERDKNLDRAKAMYLKVADKYKDSAHGKMAAKRARLLADKGKEIAEFYAELDFRLDIERQFAEAEKSQKRKK